MKNNRVQIFIFLIISLFSMVMLSSCWILEPFEHEEEEDPLGIEENKEPRRQDIKNYTFYKFEDLLPLTEGHYEGWVYQENAFISTGKFNIGYRDIFHIQTRGFVSSGRVVDLLGTPIPDGRFENYEEFDHPIKNYISIEPYGDNDNDPDKFFLAGDIVKRKSDLAFRQLSSKDVGGTFRIGTYSDNEPDNERSGIWFFKPSKDKEGRVVNVSSLKLPAAPEGFIYESWVKREFKVPIEAEDGSKHEESTGKTEVQYFSLGKFISAAGNDENDLYGPHDAKDVGFPGNDLIIKTGEFRQEVDFPIDVTSGEFEVIISLEPYLNGTDLNGNEIFNLFLLKAHIPQGTSVHEDLKLEADFSGQPTGDLAIR